MRIVDGRGSLAASCLAVCWLLGCGGNEFAQGGAAGSSSGGTGTGMAQGGSDAAGTDTGGATNAGSAGLSGSGGSGGTTVTSCACPAGSYCRDGSNDCYACSELGRLKFHPPERLATLSDGKGSRFPRVGGTGTDLLYQFEGVGLRYTTDSSSSAGSMIAQTEPQDAGPLLLPANVMFATAMSMAGFNFAFDRSIDGVQRQLYFGQWQGGLTSVDLAPDPFNAPGSNNLGVAIAVTAGAVARGYWMSDRLQAPELQLHTALFEANSPAVPVDLRIGSAACTGNHSDLTPWITPDGGTLLFSHERLDGACSSAGQSKDIYTALMVTSGQVLPTATGEPTPSQPLADVNSAQDDSDPSFSADFCELYFSSNRDGGYALYRAHRR
jgi:hypothetical protein